MDDNKLWCVGICPEGDSSHEQSPAASKEIAERALARYRAMTKVEGNQFMIEFFDEYFQVQEWEGTAEEHQEQMFYIEDWFKEPMYQCKNIEQMEKVFKYEEIVHCYNGDQELITDDYEEAKRFYGVA